MGHKKSAVIVQKCWFVRRYIVCSRSATLQSPVWYSPVKYPSPFQMTEQSDNVVQAVFRSCVCWSNRHMESCAPKISLMFRYSCSYCIFSQWDVLILHSHTEYMLFLGVTTLSSPAWNQMRGPITVQIKHGVAIVTIEVLLVWAITLLPLDRAGLCW